MSINWVSFIYSDSLKSELLIAMENPNESRTTRMFAQMALEGFSLNDEEFQLVKAAQNNLFENLVEYH